MSARRVTVRTNDAILGAAYSDDEFKSGPYEPKLGHLVEISMIDPSDKGAIGTIVKVNNSLVTIVKQTGGFMAKREKIVFDREEVNQINRRGI